MPNTKITKQKWKDHLSYEKKVYIIGFLVALLVSNFVFSVTKYNPPAERAVVIQLVDSYVDIEPLADLEPQLLLEAQADDPTLEDVSFLSIAYSGDATGDYYGAQAYMVQIYAGENDIYLMNDVLLTELIAQDYCLPLETLEGYDEFLKAHPEVTPIWRDEPGQESDEDEDEDEDAEEKPPAIQHVYALDASTLRGMVTRNAYSVKDKFALVAATSTNPVTSFRVLTLMYDHLSEMSSEASTPSEPSTSSEAARGATDSEAEE